MSRPAVIDRFGVGLPANDVRLHRIGTRSDAGPDLKMHRPVGELNGQFKESRKLEKAIKKNLQGLGYPLGGPTK